MSLLDPRFAYKPFEYDSAYVFYETQRKAIWSKDEISLDTDTTDYEFLKPHEKHVIGKILKSFTQAETIIGDYWGQMVTSMFKKPEICMMAKCFSFFETIHADAYDKLNTALNLTDYEEFFQDPVIKQKLEHLIDNQKEAVDMTMEEKALSLAVFSAFAEGVNLFSSFAILFSFSLRGKMAGVGQLIKWSVRDESLHSTAGCWLFNQLMSEYPELFTDKLKSDITDAAKMSCMLEEQFIEEVFALGDLANLSKNQMVNMIRNRTNLKLQSMGLNPIYEIDQDLLESMMWFSTLSAGMEFTDFFATRPTFYTKTEWTTNGAIY